MSLALNVYRDTGENTDFMGLDTAYAMGKRKMYNTTLDADLIRQVKILAAQLEKRQNDLLEEAIKDLLKKYNLGSNSEPFHPSL